MLSSITPLGQRGRGHSWRRTVVAFWIGAIAAGAVVFGVSGAIGETLHLPPAPTWAIAAILGLGGLADGLRMRPPGPSRQVNENWLGRYRDWLTGLGFGVQLGAGVLTITPVYAVWSLIALSTLVGLPVAAMLGVAFAVGRSSPLIVTRHVKRPSDLAGIMQGLARLYPTATPLVLAGYGAALIGVVLGV